MKGCRKKNIFFDYKGVKTQRERDYYSKNLSLLNISSYSD
jgi:hypothetical protein